MVDVLFADNYLAGVYDRWHPRAVRDDYDFYLPLIMAAGSVLDVGCGTGTLLHEARSAGHAGRLCGLDPARGMLERARARSDIEWVLGDLPSTGWNDQFDLIVMTGHAFQAITTDADLRDFASAVAQALRPGGCFAFETRNPAAGAWERWRPENAVTVEGPDDQPVRITTDVVVPFDGRTVTFTHTFDGPHPSLPQTSRSALRFLGSAELTQLLTAAGLIVANRFGDFDRSPLGPQSPEIIILAQKR